MTPARRLTAEALGTALLVAAVVGSGIMAQRLTGDRAVALLANTLATGGALVAILLVFGPISGAHLNPVGGSLIAQAAGAIAGVAVCSWLAPARGSAARIADPA